MNNLHRPELFEKIANRWEKFPGGEMILTSTEKLFSWARTSSMWPLTFGLACCAIEMMATFASRFDLDRFGMISRGSPRQSDLMIVSGTVTIKMAPRLKRLYDQMPEPKWVLAMGSCAISGGIFRNTYATVPGVERVVPVDIFVPGCPPTPEALTDGILKLQKLINEHASKSDKKRTSGKN